MKYLITFVFSITCITVVAQKSSSITKSISDDGKKMSIKYEAITGDKHISYKNVFDVREMNQAQKDALIDRIIDSLENSKPNRTTVTTRINDDERTLSLSIEAITPGKTVSYNKDFDVRGMSQKDKDALVRGIVDSLGLGKKKY